MDILDTRYYWLNRKLLLLIGQWPYQDPSAKLTRRLIVCLITVSATTVQIIKIVTSERTFNLLAEIFTNETVITMCLIKHFTFWSNNDKIKGLLEGIREHWMSLRDNEERDIFERTMKEARRYNFCCTLYLYSGLFMLVTLYFMGPILDIILPLNESRPNSVFIPAEYLIFDESNQFFVIVIHSIIIVLTLLTMISASDTMYITFLYHACAIFKISSYRLKHIFDRCVEKRENLPHDSAIFRRLTLAVQCHRNAISYTEQIVATFEICHLLNLMLVLVNISLTLYCTVVNFGKGTEAMACLMLSISQMVHLLIRSHPPQKLIDDSSAIPFDVYSGPWYLASTKSQILILLIIQRGLKPSAVILGKMCTLSMENYASVIQSSLSYFMALLSFRSI